MLLSATPLNERIKASSAVPVSMVLVTLKGKRRDCFLSPLRTANCCQPLLYTVNCKLASPAAQQPPDKEVVFPSCESAR